VEALDMC